MTDPDVVIAGRYRVVRSLGAGGMGRVWLARDEVLHRDVAVKEVLLPRWLAADEQEELRRRTLREARAAARLSHPSVIRIYNIEYDGERHWIVMEYVRSRSLLQVLRDHGALPVDDVAGIGLAVLSALDAANRVGVLHRDVKPSNVLIADDGRVVLTDFGSALLDENAGAITHSGVIVGTPQYIAPERARTGISTPESDLWSLGATLYHAVEGRGPYARPTIMETLVALANERPDAMTRAGPLRPVIEGLLRKDPRARLTPSEVERQLARIAEGPTVRLSGAAGRGWRPRRWQGLAAAATAALMVSAVALAADADDGRGRTPPAVTAPTGTGGMAETEQSRLPAGYRWWYDPTGMRVAYPAGWEMLREGSDAMLFRSPDDRRTLRVRTGEDPNAPRGYRLVRETATETDYVFEGASGPMRGRDLVVDAPGRSYLVQWRTPQADWQASLPSLDVITQSFRPAGG
ncbi:serine/threonine-protein kinase [Asanoa sp. WMMD1127]|uniref:serine/threonine-protein kinase n=1 Tax=Asanoa sp. WMMD1127 TaxID=3016107 RepID=UPI0024180F56|nr:serine/threonine-protein kinase [Asanoa sp. WMMD1127]MDG4822954.1 serine/threonine-protein kinase [Asanoa sp. WMMD1127]